MKPVIISGGYGGIGSKITTALIQDGYSVIVVGRSKKKFLARFNQEIETSLLSFHKLDVSDSDSVNRFFVSEYIVEKNIYALINAAGVQQPIGSLQEIDTSEFEKNISINLFGTMNMIKGFISVLKPKNNRRKIVNFSGGGSTSSRPYFSPYAISKTAIVRLTEIMADEFQHDGIEINAVAPGAINTSMLDDIISAGEKAGSYEYELALKRSRSGGESPQKVVDLCRFLLSEKSDGVSGKLISAIWDNYQEKKFIDRLKKDKDFCCLRRVDAINFDKIK